MIPRVLMEDHLKYTCAQRRARCDFCAKEFTGHTLEVQYKILRCSFNLISIIIHIRNEKTDDEYEYFCRSTRERAATSLCIARTNAAWRCKGDISVSTSWANAPRGWSLVVIVTKNLSSIRSALIMRNAADFRLRVPIVARPRYCPERISRCTWKIIVPRICFPAHSRTPAAASRYVTALVGVPLLPRFREISTLEAIESQIHLTGDWISNLQKRTSI